MGSFPSLPVPPAPQTVLGTGRLLSLSQHRTRDAVSSHQDNTEHYPDTYTETNEIGVPALRKDYSVTTSN